MKRTYLLAPAAMFALLATPALADKGRSDTSTSEATAPSAETADASAKAAPKICKTFQNSVSRMKAERLCMTKEQWKKFDEAQ
jgi:hypothetical protein